MWGKGRILRWEKEIHTVWMCTSIRWDIFILNYTPGKRVLGMTEDRFMEQANPVFKTAIGTVMLLARGGDPLAQDYMKAMGLEGTVDFQPLVTGEEMTESQGVTFKALNYVLSLEYRHKMMNQLILDSGMPSLLDLACGYTTRGVEMGRQGIRYVGGDLPIVASTMPQLSSLLASGDVENTARLERYLRYLLPGAPLVMLMTVLSKFLTQSGSPSLAARLLILANAVSVIGTYVLLKFCGFGVEGAALAINLGYVTAVAVFISLLLRGQLSLSFVRTGWTEFSRLRHAELGRDRQ